MHALWGGGLAVALLVITVVFTVIIIWVIIIKKNKMSPTTKETEIYQQTVNVAYQQKPLQQDIHLTENDSYQQCQEQIVLAENVSYEPVKDPSVNPTDNTLYEQISMDQNIMKLTENCSYMQKSHDHGIVLTENISYQQQFLKKGICKYIVNQYLTVLTCSHFCTFCCTFGTI